MKKSIHLAIGFAIATLFLISLVMLIPTSKATVIDPIKVELSAKKCDRSGCSTGSCIPGINCTEDDFRDNEDNETGSEPPSYSDVLLAYSKTEVFAGSFKVAGNPCSGSGDSRCKKQGCTGQIGPQLCGGCGTEDSVEPMRC